MSNTCNKETILANLRRVSGQVQGVEKMINEERDVQDILQQITAASSALRSVSKQLLVDYSSGCFGKNRKLAKSDLEKLINQMFKNM